MSKNFHKFLKKLEDITDLHPAEKLMMQMWNGFLLKVRLTMLGHKLTYAAAVNKLKILIKIIIN